MEPRCCSEPSSASTCRSPGRTIGLITAFGAGVLISAAAFELTEEAFRSAGGVAATLGLLAGSLAFFVGDWFIDAASGMALVLGALLDGIPESAAIGISLLGGQGVGVAVVAAVFLSNVPESLSATTGLRASGRSPR